MVVALLPSQFQQARQALRVYVYQSVLGMPIIEGLPRREVDCQGLAGPSTMVAVAFGQSNAANFGQVRYRTTGSVFSFYHGHCYRAEDPMPGANGGGGSVWSRLGDQLVAGRHYDSVVFIPHAVGGTEIARWIPGGDLHPGLLDALKRARAVGLTPTHLLWHQGETDTAKGTRRDVYKAKFRQMLDSIRAAGIRAPVYVSVASYCYGESSAEVRQAQIELVNRADNILPGPDTDVFAGSEDRYDECHFSESGLLKIRDAWLNSLTSSRP
jgi:hypothetical protein